MPDVTISQTDRSPANIAPTLVGLLRSRALSEPDRIAFTYLRDGEGEEASLSYKDLDLWARAIAVKLKSLQAEGERVIISCPVGLEYIAAFFGCLYAGAIAAPAYPPRRNRNLLRLKAIVADAQPRVVLSTSALLRGIESTLMAAFDRLSLAYVAADNINEEDAEQWLDPGAKWDDLAFIQYTSGSTSSPRGVMVTHGNALHNQQLIQRAFQQTHDSVIVSWLPLYHDMGLVGTALQTVYLGARCIFMSPASFLQRPARWLQAISRYRATTSGGPNFAYDLCVRKIGAPQKSALDLRTWRVAFNGAEPVRAETLRAFAAHFEDCGFRWEAFAPCYGLAEVTLLVGGSVRSGGPVLCSIEGAPLQYHKVVSTEAASETARHLAGYLSHTSDLQVLIVNPETRTRCHEDEVGEIWVSGASVAQGYWNRAEETARTFRACLADNGAGPFLRTGDLGFVRGDEIFVTGRLKDLIIIRGRNHYPQDIERTAEQSHPALRVGCGAAFTVEPEQRLVIVQEVDTCERIELAAVAQSIRQSVAIEHETQVDEIVLIKPGTILKTSSGKIQRKGCLEQYLSASLKEVGRYRLRRSDVEDDLDFMDSEALSTLDHEHRLSVIEDYLRRFTAQALKISEAEIGREEPLIALGLDSLLALEYKHGIGTRLGFAISTTMLLEGSSIADLAARILCGLTERGQAVLTRTAAPSSHLLESLLTPGEQALWFLSQVSPDSPVYNITTPIRIRRELNVSALHRALQKLIDRHASLRSTFPSLKGKPVRQVQAHVRDWFQHLDASNWSESELSSWLVRESRRGFDLERGPLLRVSLLARTETEHILLLAIHHIITDFWSLETLVGEIVILYGAEQKDSESPLPPLQMEYTDYVRLQMDLLNGSRGEQLSAYWRSQLSGELPVLNLPADHPRPATQSFRGASCPFKLSLELADNLRSLSKAKGATLYMLLLASFQTLLFRYTGQDEILVGSPAANRPLQSLANVVGYFVNPIVLRAKLSGVESFASFLERARQTVLGALEHQDYPFALLVEGLQPVRDPSRSPLFQAMFILQKTIGTDLQNLALIAVGDTEAGIKMGDLLLEPVALEQNSTQFDMTLIMADVAESLAGCMQYNTDLFDAVTISRMTGHFQNLLEDITANPWRSPSALALLSEAELYQILREWNDTATEVPQTLCIHDLFEAQALRAPGSTAIIFEGTSLSYSELNCQANRLAHYLLSLGAGPEILIGICLKRSPEMIVAMLAILKAGGAYMPLDPAYPDERLAYMLEDSGAAILVTTREQAGRFASFSSGAPFRDPGESGFGREGAGRNHSLSRFVCLDSDYRFIIQQSDLDPIAPAHPDNPAYVIYTSGSTGKPKGVMISHRSVANFFFGMDERVECGEADTLLALTSISFDISVLELLWTLTRGARVILLSEPAIKRASDQIRRVNRNKPIKFSLFYFASADAGTPEDKYRLLIEGSKYGDRNGFEAVWTPERHFHAFGGLYPNPSVTGALLAGITERIGIRAGSVVLPLHNPIRVAEEWSLVDNLSRGRVGVSFASGWHANDFAFFPTNYENRKELMYQGIKVVQRLWRGELIKTKGAAADEIEVQIYPKPVQPELPIWITAAGAPETFIKAGEMGAHVLTHLLGQDLQELKDKVGIYRESLARTGLDPQSGQVTLMLHTFLDEDRELVRQKIRKPFTDYLRSSIGLIGGLIRSLNLQFDLQKMSAEDMDDLLTFAFDRYFETSALFGTPRSCAAIIDELRQIGIDEVGCLIDFGIDVDLALAGLRHLNALKERMSDSWSIENYSLVAQARTHKATLLQCTPSMMLMLSMSPDFIPALESVRALLLGGEALPQSLSRLTKSEFPGRIINMYGPTETTVWSSVYELTGDGGDVAIGKPISNTQIYILDSHLQPAPIGVTGEIHIGGDGLARGYLGHSELTAERFIPDAFSQRLGARLYKTGDLARYLSDGNLEYLGRLDNQIKIRGYRVELEEIRAALSQHGSVNEAVVVSREFSEGDKRLAAYIGIGGNQTTLPTADELRSFLASRLPDFMVPASFTILESLPRTANGKLDLRALPPPEWDKPSIGSASAAPETPVEQALARTWSELLVIDRVGIHDNFFDLGGHSILATQVISRLREILQVEIPLGTFLENPTVASLAAAIERVASEQKKDITRIAQIWLEVERLSPEDLEKFLAAKIRHQAKVGNERP